MSVLVIAGFDSSGDAGVLRDCAVLAELGLTARVAVTAVTAQGAMGVTALHPVPPAVVAAQIAAAGPVRAIKSGMLANAGIVRAVARALPCGIPFVLDPVLAASSGAELLDVAGRAALLQHLLARATLITPNLPEAAKLTGLPEEMGDDSRNATAAALIAMGAQAVLLKGGHADGPWATDWLHRPGQPPLAFTAPRLPHDKRGTGCTLATALTVALASGADLPEACAFAREHLQRWLGEGSERRTRPSSAR